jgi:hypothetical protein
MRKILAHYLRILIVEVQIDAKKIDSIRHKGGKRLLP